MKCEEDPDCKAAEKEKEEAEAEAREKIREK